MAVVNPAKGSTYYLAAPTESGEYGVFGVVAVEVFPRDRAGRRLLVRRTADNGAGFHWHQDADALFETLDEAAAAAAFVNARRRLDGAAAANRGATPPE